MRRGRSIAGERGKGLVGTSSGPIPPPGDGNGKSPVSDDASVGGGEDEWFVFGMVVVVVEVVGGEEMGVVPKGNWLPSCQWRSLGYREAARASPAKIKNKKGNEFNNKDNDKIIHTCCVC